MIKKENKVDIVVPWVDGNDPEWLKVKSKYQSLDASSPVTDARDNRYRDWDTIRFLFRGIERHMPWVNNVFLITWGHLPSWINPNAEKLRIVKHSDYIPEKYLPTFCSHTIELNLHRIKDLSEQFIYFNDDLLVMRDTSKEDFFHNGLPRDYAILNPIPTTNIKSVQDCTLTDLEIINSHFNKKAVIKQNLGKWLSPAYGKLLFRSMCLLPWPYFAGFLSRHQCNAYLKSTFEEVWSKEYGILDETCSHKFRTRRDVNQWVMRYWQLASGKFEPIKPYGEVCYLSDDNKYNSILFTTIENSQNKTIVIHDDFQSFDSDRYLELKTSLISHLEHRYPHKSAFEK